MILTTSGLLVGRPLRGLNTIIRGTYLLLYEVLVRKLGKRLRNGERFDARLKEEPLRRGKFKSAHRLTERRDIEKTLEYSRRVYKFLPRVVTEGAKITKRSLPDPNSALSTNRIKFDRI